MDQLRDRIAAETGIDGRDIDAHALAGFLNRYRPHGIGLERLIHGDAIQESVCGRLQKVFAATASDWSPADWYFVIRRPLNVAPERAQQIALSYVNGLQRLAEWRGEALLARHLNAHRVEYRQSAGHQGSDEVSTASYECITDFLSELDEEVHPIFVLREAVYSMAADNLLKAFILWPASVQVGAPNGVIDDYFDLWRHGLSIGFPGGGTVTVSPVLRTD
jgi:hypothetical protein